MKRRQFTANVAASVAGVGMIGVSLYGAHIGFDPAEYKGTPVEDGIKDARNMILDVHTNLLDSACDMYNHLDSPITVGWNAYSIRYLPGRTMYHIIVWYQDIHDKKLMDGQLPKHTLIAERVETHGDVKTDKLPINQAARHAVVSMMTRGLDDIQSETSKALIDG